MDDGKAFRVGCFGAMGAVVGLAVLFVVITFGGLFFLVGCPAFNDARTSALDAERDRVKNADAEPDANPRSVPVPEAPEREFHVPPFVSPLAIGFYASSGAGNESRGDADSLVVIFSRSSNTPLPVRFVAITAGNITSRAVVEEMVGSTGFSKRYVAPAGEFLPALNAALAEGSGTLSFEGSRLNENHKVSAECVEALAAARKEYQAMGGKW